MIPPKTIFPVMSLALMTGIALFGTTPVVAAEKSANDPAVTAADKAGQPDILQMRVSREGYAAMRAVKAARIAIFDGNPDLAKKMVTIASESLDAAARDDTKYVARAKTTQSGAVTGKFIPIDGGLAIADDFTMTPEKKAKIAEANQHFKKGEKKKALETLRLASIDVIFQRVLIPVKRTLEHVNTAADLLHSEKYYQANLALKAAEEGLVFDSVDLIEPANNGKTESVNADKKEK